MAVAPFGLFFQAEVLQGILGLRLLFFLRVRFSFVIRQILARFPFLLDFLDQLPDHLALFSGSFLVFHWFVLHLLGFLRFRSSRPLFFFYLLNVLFILGIL